MIRNVASLVALIATALLLGALAGSVMTLAVAEPVQAISSHKNGKIAFSIPAEDGHQSIYLCDPDGSNLTRFTADLMQARSPAISPDGTEIAFSGYRGDYNDIYVMDAVDRDGDGNGDQLRRLTNDWANDNSPTWSPDGKKIAFSSDIEDGDDYQETDIYVMDADGSNRTNLITRPGEKPDSAAEEYPAFSPDGEKIAFATSRDVREDALWSADWEIYVMNADGSNETRLTSNGGYAPTYSPSGEKIAFAKRTYLFNEHGIRYDQNGMPDENGKRLPYARIADIYATNVDGGDETRLTSTSSSIDPPGSGPRTFYAEMDAYPAFSPDGTRIAFSQSIRMYNRTGEQESYRRRLYSITSDGTDLITLADELGLDEPPHVDWGPEPNGVAPANEATEAQDTTANERTTANANLPPSGGPNLLLPVAVLLWGAGILGFAVSRGGYEQRCRISTQGRSGRRGY